ncbi:MAG: hypothetical protein J2P17_21070, partial [Mycobacterium sp.]|nr:hypothetical protein [Mycobacterium sp.]
ATGASDIVAAVAASALGAVLDTNPITAVAVITATTPPTTPDRTACRDDPGARWAPLVVGR